MLWPSSTAYNLDFVKRFVPGYDGMTIEMGLGHLVDKSILVYKDGKYQMHGLIAESCRKQVFTEEEYKAYRNFDRYLECIDEFDKQYDSNKSNKEIRSAIIESLLFVIPSDDTYLLRKAYEYREAKVYETTLKIKLLKLSGNCISDEAIYKQLHPEVMVDGDKKTLTDEDKRVQHTSADQLYYAWLENESGYSNSIPSDGIVEFKGKDGKHHSFKMIWVDGDAFKMGAQKTNKKGDNYDDEAYDSESPVHNVELSDFYIGETPVTQGLWKAVMGRDNNPSSFDKGNDYPVESVSWYDCLNFIIELNKKTGLKFRFPTEAQWEFAARGGNKHSPYKYSGGKNIEDVAVYWGNSKNDSDDHCSSPVKSKAPNELGIYDMSGNVYEWCQDWYDDYTSGNVDNPTGPSSGSSRVLRGGSWHSGAGICRVSDRSNNDPDLRSNYYGMRLALPCSPFPS